MSNDSNDILVIVPAWNEASGINAVLSEIAMHLPGSKVVVVNDGSTDDTSKVVSLSGNTVLDLPINLGVGGALRVGYKYATRHDFTRVLQIDADGQHDARDAIELIKHMDRHHTDIVIGSRFTNTSPKYEISRSRRILLMFLAWLLSKVVKSELTDVTSGFRLLGPRAIALFSNEFPSEYLGDTIESLILARDHGLTISEVGVQMRSRQHGEPSQSTIKSVAFVLRVLLLVLLSYIQKPSRLRIAKQ